jgi:hypothetical protein
MSLPPGLIRVVHFVLVEHYKRHHGADDPDRAEVFAETFADRLFAPLIIGDANRAADDLDIQELPKVWPGSDESWRLAGALRETLAREVRKWLLEAQIWRYSADLKARAFANAVANAVDFATYRAAVENAKIGHMPTNPYEGVSEHERAAIEAERRWQEGRRR